MGRNNITTKKAKIGSMFYSFLLENNHIHLTWGQYCTPPQQTPHVEKCFQHQSRQAQKPLILTQHAHHSLCKICQGCLFSADLLELNIRNSIQYLKVFRNLTNSFNIFLTHKQDLHAAEGRNHIRNQHCSYKYHDLYPTLQVQISQFIHTEGTEKWWDSRYYWAISSDGIC